MSDDVSVRLYLRTLNFEYLKFSDVVKYYYFDYYYFFYPQPFKNVNIFGSHVITETDGGL